MTKAALTSLKLQKELCTSRIKTNEKIERELQEIGKIAWNIKQQIAGELPESDQKEIFMSEITKEMISVYVAVESLKINIKLFKEHRDAELAAIQKKLDEYQYCSEC